MKKTETSLLKWNRQRQRTCGGKKGAWQAGF